MTTVVKRAALAPQLSGRIPGALLDANAEAQRRLADVEDAARQAVERARTEAQSIREEAAARGREEGLASATEVLVRAVAERESLLASVEGDLVELAFEIARRVLASAADRAAVTEVAARALEAARLREHVTVRVHPEDLQALRAAEQDLAALLLRAPGLALREDAAVGRGGIIVETEAGRIDTGIDAQLAALRRALVAERSA
jgi:type III secretion protein L